MKRLIKYEDTEGDREKKLKQIGKQRERGNDRWRLEEKQVLSYRQRKIVRERQRERESK